MKTLFKTIVIILLSLLFIHCKPEPIDYRDQWCGDYACNTDYYYNDTTVIVSVNKVNDSMLSFSNIGNHQVDDIRVSINGHFFERKYGSYDVFSGNFHKDSVNFQIGFYLHFTYYYYFNGTKL